MPGPQPQPTDSEGVLDALGNPVRRQIVVLLAHGPRPVGAIARAFPISRPAVSKHLRVLEDARLVTFERVGTRNLFRLERKGFDAARAWLDAFWDDALARFARVAEQADVDVDEGDGGDRP